MWPSVFHGLYLLINLYFGWGQFPEYGVLGAAGKLGGVLCFYFIGFCFLDEPALNYRCDLV